MVFSHISFDKFSRGFFGAPDEPKVHSSWLEQTVAKLDRPLANCRHSQRMIYSYAICCSVFKRGRLWPKLCAKCPTFSHLVKLGDGWAKHLSRFFKFSTSAYDLIYLWWGGHCTGRVMDRGIVRTSSWRWILTIPPTHIYKVSACQLPNFSTVRLRTPELLTIQQIFPHFFGGWGWAWIPSSQNWVEWTETCRLPNCRGHRRSQRMF